MGGNFMAFAFYFFVGWLGIYCFFLCKKSLSIVENIILYLLILIVHINWSWLIYEEFLLLKFSHDPTKFVAMLINRSVITPFFILFCFNIISADSSIIKKTIYFLFTSLILTAFVQISILFKSVYLISWNLGYDFIYFLCLLIFCQFFHLFYSNYVMEKEIRTE